MMAVEPRDLDRRTDTELLSAIAAACRAFVNNSRRQMTISTRSRRSWSR
jgi:hypothetical protein